MDDSLAIPLHTAVPGRMRLKVHGLYRGAPQLGQRLEAAVQGLAGVTNASASTRTGNVTVLFAHERTHADIQACVEREARRLDADAVPQKQARQVARNDYKPIGAQTTVRVSADIAVGETPPRWAWHALAREQVVEDCHAAPETGLTSQEAAARRARFGGNTLAEAQPRSSLSLALDQFASLPVGLLGAAALVSAATGGVVDAIAILGVVALNAGIGYATERQSERVITGLTRLGNDTATVVRDGARQELCAEMLTVGDILFLSPGQYVAADARLLQTRRLAVDESQLTGESVPAIKSAKEVLPAQTSLAERTNLVYRGTRVTGGGGVAVVVATGAHTEIARVQSLAQDAEAPETPMQRQLARMGIQLVWLSGAICAGVFAIGLLRGYGVLQMFKSAISLAVAALPEGLPTVATTTLALGIRDMRRHGVLIRQLDAVEALGAMEVLCLDKTGTLTMNRLSVSDLHLDGERISVERGRFFVDGGEIEPAGHSQLERLLHTLALCNEATVDDGEDDASVVSGSSTEAALLELAQWGGVDIAALRESYPLHKMHYRSADRLFMRTTHETADGNRLSAVKGNPEQVMALCQWRLAGDRVVELTDTERKTILRENERMAGDALRVLGMAFAEGHRKPHKEGLTWLGLVGMQDTLRPGVQALMRDFRAAGIQPVMITGDQSATARAVARQIGLNGNEPLKLVDSSQLEALDLELIAHPDERVHVFSRVSPEEKLKIVQAFQHAGKVVAMSGDGVNDGPALKAANIGIAMGGPGTEAARSVGDVVLEGDCLESVLTAIRQGRTIHGNIRKSLRFLLATNLSEIEMMLVAVALGMGAPLSPMQLLWINLISDIFPGLALALEPPESDAMQSPPRDPREPIVGRQDFKRLGRESAAITAGAMASYAWGLSRYGAGVQASTPAFATLVLGQLLHALSCRSTSTTVLDRRAPNRYLDIALGGSLLLQVVAMAIPGLRGLLGVAPVGLLDSAAIAAGATLPLAVNETTKRAGGR